MAKKDKYSSRNADMNYFYEDTEKTNIVTAMDYVSATNIKNITLTDYNNYDYSNNYIKILGSKIKEDAINNPNIDNFKLPDINTTNILDNTTYKIYGSPEKWIFDNHQQFNNCGVDSCLNILVMAGKMTIKDQDKTEKQFTQKIWDLGLCDDHGIFGTLDIDDGGTNLNNYVDILKMYDLDSSTKTYGMEIDETTGTIKYIKVDDDVKPINMSDLATAVESGKGVIISVSSDILWGEDEPKEKLDHAIIVTGVVRIDSTNVVGFYIHDTGAWATRYISVSDLAEATLAETKIDIYEKASDTEPCQTNVDHNIFCVLTDDNIKQYTAPTKVTGNNLDNIITANDANNIIKAQKGDDTVYGYGGADTIYGGVGDDILYGFDINNTALGAVDDDNKIYGEAGNDSIYGGNNNDYLDGGAGNDTILGYGGNDTIKGGSGNDSIHGDHGNDSTHFGNDTIYGGAGNDSIYGNQGNDLLYGDTGNDIIEGGKGNDIIYGGIGNDTIHGNEDEDIIYGGAGNDSLCGDDGDDKIFGQTGKNFISGGEGDDTLVGGTGNDSIYGGTGDDGICAGKGNDYIEGNNGNDTIAGDAGNDSIYGGDGNDTIYGDSYYIKNNDTIASGSGNDTIYGGAGDDEIHACGGNDVIYAQENDGNDAIDFGSGTTTYIIDNHTYGNDIVWTDSSKLTSKIKYDDISAYELNYQMIRYESEGINVINVVLSEDEDNCITFNKFKNTSKLKTYIIDETNTEYLLSADETTNGNIYIKNTKSNNILVTANDPDININITTTNYSDIVYMSNGEHTTTYTKGKDYYISVSGNDVYNCSTFNQNTYLTIIDGAGNDTLNIDSDKNNVRLFFDLQSDGSYTYNTNLYITNKTVISDAESLLNKFDYKIGGSIDVNDYFGSGVIENVNCNTDTINIEEMVNSIKTSVISWFSQSGHTGYNSVQEVLNTKNNDLINSLLTTCYTKDWP